jgi:hypothetical protein
MAASEYVAVIMKAPSAIAVPVWSAEEQTKKLPYPRREAFFIG